MGGYAFGGRYGQVTRGGARNKKKAEIPGAMRPTGSLRGRGRYAKPAAARVAYTDSEGRVVEEGKAKSRARPVKGVVTVVAMQCVKPKNAPVGLFKNTHEDSVAGIFAI